MPKPRPGRGGYRAPRNPAPASGPGAASQRTDGGPGHTVARMLEGTPASAIGPWGSKAALQRTQSNMPAPPPGGTPASAAGGPVPPQVLPGGLYDPTARPDEPITAGARMGPGQSWPGGEPFLRDDPNELLVALAVATNGHPDVMRLLGSRGLV